MFSYSKNNVYICIYIFVYTLFFCIIILEKDINGMRAKIISLKQKLGVSGKNGDDAVIRWQVN